MDRNRGILISGRGIDTPVEQRFKRIRWLREECYVECPHCKFTARPCFSERHAEGLAMCRNSNCHQAFSIFQAKVTDRWGQEVREFPATL